MLTALRLLWRVAPLTLYGLALVAISLLLRELAADRPLPVALDASGLILTEPLPHFAAWRNEGGSEFLIFEGPWTALPLAIAMFFGMTLGGFHRSLLGQIGLVSMGVGAGTNAVEAWLTGGVIDYVWIEPFRDALLIFNSADVALVVGIAFLIASEILDAWAWRRTQPRTPVV